LHQGRSRHLIDVKRLPMQIGSPAQCKIQHATADRFEAETVDQNKSTKHAIHRIGFKHDRLTA